MSIPGGSNLLLLTSAAGGGGGGYEISRSLRFNSSDSAYLSERLHQQATEDVDLGGVGEYLADIHFIDGQALDPTSFGEFDTNGVWQPIDASGLPTAPTGSTCPSAITAPPPH
jgi:hypothetical protein